MRNLEKCRPAGALRPLALNAYTRGVWAQAAMRRNGFHDWIDCLILTEQRGIDIGSLLVAVRMLLRPSGSAQVWEFSHGKRERS